MGPIEDGSVTSRHTCGQEPTSVGHTDARKGSAPETPHRINPKNPVRPDIVKMIRDEVYSSVDEYGPVKIVQHEESGKPEIKPPERIRNPAVEVVVIGWRCVVGDHWWSFDAVIVIDYRRIWIRFGIFRHGLVGLGDCMRLDGQLEIGGRPVKTLQRLVPTHGQLPGIGGIPN